MLRKGEKIGPYILLDKIGRGGFGEVWLAEKRSALATTKFALKLPNDRDVNHALIRAEAEVWCNVSGHPNILPIIEADIYDDQIVIASEYVQGGSLAGWLKEHNGKAPDIKTAIQITQNILEGLEFLHGRKVVHRDLKPENILIQEGTPRIADFGISKILQDEDSSTRQVSGTIAYMPPEAFEGKRSYQTDLWSVGVILYQLLSGRLPFEKADFPAQMRAIIYDEPDALPSDIPFVWSEFIKRALAKERSQRFQTATEMKKACAEAFRKTDFDVADADISDDPTKVFETADFPGKLPVEQLKNVGEENEYLTLHQTFVTDNSEKQKMRKLTGQNQIGTADISGKKKNIFLVLAGIVGLAAFAGTVLFLIKYSSNEQTISINAAEQTAPLAKPVKKYLEMSDKEKIRFVSNEADKILQVIHSGNESDITPQGKQLIKDQLDFYAKRRQLPTKDSCGTQTYQQSDLSTVLKRGVKIIPDITAGFKEKEIPPQVGIYIAMVESEFCPCMRGYGGLGGLGIFQFSSETAVTYGLKAVKDSTADNPDERCNPEPASLAAASYVKKLLAEDFGNGANQTTFAVAAYNAGEKSLKDNILKITNSIKEEPISFWTLIENQNKMSEQFQVENSKYLPKFFAAAIVGENPKVFDVEMQPLSSYVK